MDIGAISFLLGLMILVGLFISRPFLVGSTSAVNQEDYKLSILLAEQERAINALQELDFDHFLGKVPEEDYPVQRAALIARGVEVMRQVDETRAGSIGGDIQIRIEAAIAARHADAVRAKASPARRGKRIIPSVAAPDDELEAMLAARRRERSEKAAGFCPQCGKSVQLSDRFCSKCGASLSIEETQGG